MLQLKKCESKTKKKCKDMYHANTNQKKVGITNRFAKHITRNKEYFMLMKGLIH
jgi:hypothetical protein